MFIDKKLKRINIDAPYTAENGTRYSNLRDPAIRQLFGITEIPDPERKDDKFYYVTEQVDAPYVVNTPKNLVDLKKTLVATLKSTAGSLLSQSDWKVIRASEGGSVVDQATLDYRVAVRRASNVMEALVNNCNTVDELAALNLNQWPTQGA